MTSIFSVASSRLNPKLLAKRLEFQQWKMPVFGSFVAPEFIKNGGQGMVKPLVPTGPQFTGAPIEVHTEFQTQGKTDMDIPIRYRLTGRPRFGDDTLKGKAMKAKIMFRHVFINYLRNAYAPPTGMSAQITREYADQLISDANAQLTAWLQDYLPGNFNLTALQGYSYDLTCPSTLFGRAKSIISHPNFFTPDAGRVSIASLPGTAAYEAAVCAAVDGLSDSAEDYMSVNFLSNLVLEANLLGIEPIVIDGGFSFFPIFLSIPQWSQLKKDTKFEEINKRFFPNDFKKNPMINNAYAAIDGAMIYVDQTLFGLRTLATDANMAADKVYYGPAPTTADRGVGHTVADWTATKLDTNDRKVGILFGKSAMSVGIGSKLAFTELVDDHGFFKEIGINEILSAVRGDIFDVDGYGITRSNGTVSAAGEFVENNSSLAFATYSKNSLTYGI